MYDSILLLLHCGAYLDPEDKAHFFVIGPWMDGWWLHIHTRTYMAEVHHYFTMTEYRKWLNVFALLLTADDEINRSVALELFVFCFCWGNGLSPSSSSSS